jgi:hypothetical protein
VVLDGLVNKGRKYHMTHSLQALLAEWKETRGITLEFINELSDADLDKKLPG